MTAQQYSSEYMFVVNIKYILIWEILQHLRLLYECNIIVCVQEEF